MLGWRCRPRETSSNRMNNIKIKSGRARSRNPANKSSNRMNNITIKSGRAALSRNPTMLTTMLTTTHAHQATALIFGAQLLTQDQTRLTLAELRNIIGRRARSMVICSSNRWPCYHKQQFFVFFIGKAFALHTSPQASYITWPDAHLFYLRGVII